MPENSIIFYSLFFEDKNSNKLSPRQYLEKFLKVSKAPIYTYYSTLVGSGSLGGYVIDGKLLIQNMTKVLINKKALENNHSIQAVFDYKALEKYNIDIQRISNKTLLLNKPSSYFKIYKSDILISVFSIAFFVFISFLFINMQRKQKLQEELAIKDKLLRTKEEFNSFFQLSINLQIIANASDGKVIQINSSSKSILGYEAEELIDTTFLDLVHPDDIQDTINEMKKLSNGENVYFFENRYTHKDGSYVNLAWSATTSSDSKLIYATAQNTTKVKLIELQKKEKENLLYQQNKMAAMGEMLANIAHQWRQPLSTISTASTGTKIQKEMGCLSDEQLNSALVTINDSAQYLSTTIDDFRGFFNPNNNMLSNVRILETLNKALKLVNSQFTTKGIEIIKNIDSYEFVSIENELI